MTWKIVPLSSVLTESKVESTRPDSARRITVKLNVKGVEKRPDGNTIEGGTRYYVRRKGQFIYGKQNLHKGAFGVVPDELDGFESSMDIPAFDVSDDCLPEWVFYFLKQGNFYLGLEDLAKGTGSKRIHPESLYSVKMPLPSIDEQHEILKRIEISGSKLDQVDAYINRQLSTLADLRQSILREAVQGQLTACWRQQNPATETGSDLLKHIRVHKQQLIAEGKLRKEKPLPPVTPAETPFELPDGWVWCRFGDLCFVTKLAGFEYTNHINLQEEGEVPVVRAQNVKKGVMDTTNVLYIDLATSLKLQRCALDKPAILITFIGQGGIGNVALFDKQQRWHLAPNVAKIEPYEVAPSLNFLLYYLLSAPGQDQIFSISKSTGQPSLSMATIREMRIPLPPLAEQQTIGERVAGLFGKVDALAEQLNTARQVAGRLRQAVLRKAFSPQSETVASTV